MNQAAILSGFDTFLNPKMESQILFDKIQYI